MGVWQRSCAAPIYSSGMSRAHRSLRAHTMWCSCEALACSRSPLFHVKAIHDEQLARVLCRSGCLGCKALPPFSLCVRVSKLVLNHVLQATILPRGCHRRPPWRRCLEGSWCSRRGACCLRLRGSHSKTARALGLARACLGCHARVTRRLHREVSVLGPQTGSSSGFNRMITGLCVIIGVKPDLAPLCGSIWGSAS